MEKLIELLNKYLFELWRKTIIERYDKDSLENVCWTFRWIVEWEKNYPYTSIWWIEVISKKFWFIKWLVENEKIDMAKARYYWDKIYYKEYWVWDFCCADYEFVIMLLSISDNPIQDLISLLK